MKTKITITPAHAKKAKSYLNQTDCLLATALKEKFPNLNIEVLGFSFKLNGVEIPFSDKTAYKITRCYQKNNRLDISTQRKAILEKPFSFTVDIPKELLTANKNGGKVKS